MQAERRSDRTKAHIKETLLARMRKKAFEEITVTELCRLAGVNRSTFYAHFYDINDLLDEINRDLFAEIAAQFGTANAGREDIARTLLYLQTRQSLFQLLLRQNGRAKFGQQLTGYFARLPDGEQTQEDPAHRYRAQYHLAGNFAVVCQWILDDFPVSPECLAELLWQNTPEELR